MGGLGLLAAAAVAAGQTQAWAVRSHLPNVNALDEGVENRYWHQPEGDRYVYEVGYVTNAYGGTAIATYRINADNPLDFVATYYPADYATTTRQHRGTGIDVDQVSGDVYVCGEGQNASGNYDYVTIKYGFNLQPPPPLQRWLPDGVRIYNGPANGDDRAVDVAVLRTGALAEPQCIVTGRSAGNGTLNDILTLRYDVDGGPSTEWPALGNDALGERRYDGPAHGTDWPAELSLIKSAEADDPQVVVYLAGTEWAGPANNFDVVTIHWGLDGAWTWVRHYNGPASGEDTATGIDLFHQGGFTGAVVVGGYTAHAEPPQQRSGPNMPLGPVPDTDYLALTYRVDGTPWWTDLGWGPGARVWNGPGGAGVSDDAAYDVDTWADGPPGLASEAWVWMTGRARKDLHYEIGTVVYDLLFQTGAQVGENLYGSPTRDDAGFSVHIDGTGHAYVAGGYGAAIGGPSYTDWVTIKYANIQAQISWLANYTGYGLTGFARCLWVNWSAGPGDVFVTGRSGAPLTGFDAVELRYTQP